VGDFVLQAECNQTDYLIVATKETYEPGRKTISKKNIADITLLLSNIDRGAPIGTDLTKYLNINPIYFDLDKSFIREDAKLVLEKIVAYMKAYPDSKIEVRSHTDSRASSNYNKTLSERRAKETVVYLTSKDIDPPTKMMERTISILSILRLLTYLSSSESVPNDKPEIAE